MAHRIILDVDTGTDDAVALMVAALSPDLELLGASTAAGNCRREMCTENTLRVFDAIGVVDIGVYAGMAAPMVRPDIDRGDWSRYLDLPAARSTKQAQHAVDWLIETLLASDGEIILVPVGPLTNIATAIRKEPRILPKIAELVIMGGGHDIGNVTPTAEFNIWVDPEAARLVMQCGRPMRLLPLDATHKALVTAQDCERLRALGTPAGIAATACIAPRIQNYDQSQPMKRPGAPVHDALAVCAIIDPTIIQTVYINVDIETKGELTDGRTVCDFNRRSRRAPNVHVATDADEPKFIRMLTDILGRSTECVAGSRQ